MMCANDCRGTRLEKEMHRELEEAAWTSRWQCAAETPQYNKYAQPRGHTRVKISHGPAWKAADSS